MIKSYKVIAFAIGICLFSKTFASGDNYTIGSVQSAIGISAASISNVYSAGNNQAATAFLEKPAIGIFYGNSFFLKGLNNFAFEGAFPIKKAGTLGVNINYLGYNAYNDKKIGLSYSLKLIKELSIGLQLDYLNTKIGNNYGSKNYFTFEFGIFARPIKELSIGAHIYNPLSLTVDEATNEKVPTIFKLAATYNIKEVIYLTAETEKDIRDEFLFRFGLDYRPIDILSVRAGISTQPITGVFGVGFKVKGLNIDLNSSFHPNLGFSTQAGLSYAFGK
jgi:hypothetical protein